MKVLESRCPRDFPGGPVAETMSSQCKGPGVRSLVRELYSSAPTKKISDAAIKDPMCCN